mgnify:CR=1 FL=1
MPPRHTYPQTFHPALDHLVAATRRAQLALEVATERLSTGIYSPDDVRDVKRACDALRAALLAWDGGNGSSP